jgi:ADP-heptose:LPS heptosyltransferase
MRLENAHLLISRTDNLGDVALTLPLAGYLRHLYPKMKISFLCRAYAAPLVRYCSAVDSVAEIEKLPDLQLFFAKTQPDAVIFAKPDKRVARAAMRAAARVRVGTSHRWFHWLYCSDLAHFSRARSNLHEAQLNFKLLGPLGIDYVPELAQVPSLYQLTAPAYQGPIELSAQNFNLIVHPKSNGNGREWPAKRYTELARQLASRTDVKIWVTGTSGEGRWLAENEPELFRQPNVSDACGCFALDEFIRFLNSADGVVANSTGPLHISAALGKPTLGLFPQTRLMGPMRWGALGRSAETLCASKTCTDCTKPAECQCMDSILPGAVAEVVLKWRDCKHNEEARTEPCS